MKKKNQFHVFERQCGDGKITYLCTFDTERLFVGLLRKCFITFWIILCWFPWTADWTRNLNCPLIWKWEKKQQQQQPRQRRHIFSLNLSHCANLFGFFSIMTVQITRIILSDSVTDNLWKRKEQSNCLKLNQTPAKSKNCSSKNHSFM